MISRCIFVHLPSNVKKKKNWQERKPVNYTIIVLWHLLGRGGRRGGLIWTIFFEGLVRVPFGALVREVVDKGEGDGHNKKPFRFSDLQWLASL